MSDPSVYSVGCLASNFAGAALPPFTCTASWMSERAPAGVVLIASAGQGPPAPQDTPHQCLSCCHGSVPIPGSSRTPRSAPCCWRLRWHQAPRSLGWGVVAAPAWRALDAPRLCKRLANSRTLTQRATSAVRGRRDVTACLRSRRALADNLSHGLRCAWPRQRALHAVCLDVACHSASVSGSDRRRESRSSEG
jgi:hypothetical protein